MTDWNFADVWETVADTDPARARPHPRGPAGHLGRIRPPGRRRGPGRFSDVGVGHQDKVAHYLYNGTEYLESTFAIFKIGLVPVNTNYRYTDDELVYLWDNADAVAVIFHGTFVERIEGLRDRVPGVRSWLWVDDGTGPCPDWATPYEELAAAETHRVTAPWGRSGDDLLMLYTGGPPVCPRASCGDRTTSSAASTPATCCGYPRTGA